MVRVVAQRRKQRRVRARRGIRRRWAEPHVNSDHFKKAMQDMPQALAETPQIINTTIEGANDWSRMGK